MVGTLIVKLAPVIFEASKIAGLTVGAVLQVTAIVPLSEVSSTMITLFELITAVVLTTHVPAEAATSQEN